jgi:molybdopterin-guanine dinucleotide biosynthesis protein A
MANRYVVIMAGGRGERFWPQSRLATPKHLLPIVGEQALLVQTIERVLPMIPAERVLIITNRQQAPAIRKLCPMLPARTSWPSRWAATPRRLWGWRCCWCGGAIRRRPSPCCRPTT